MANIAQAGLSPRLYGGAPQWTENPVGYGSALADRQLSDWQEQLNKYPRLYSGGGYGAAPQTGGTGNAGVGSSWASGLPSAPGGGAAGSGASGFPLLQTSKSPHGNAVLDALLGRIAGLPNDPNQPLLTSTKDQAQEGRINTAGANFDTSTGQANQRLADFTSQFYAAAPQAKSQTEQEIGSVGQYYAPATDPTSVTATLNRLAAQRQQAVQGSIQRALANAQRQSSLARLGQGGADSYVNQQFMDTAAGIRAEEARQQAELARSNFMAVRSGQNALLGTRSGLLNSYLTRALTPINAGQQLMSGQLANLGQLGGIGNANRLYQTPEQLLAARMGLLGQYSGNLNALNIFGVGGNFGSPALNWGPPPLGRPALPFAPPSQYGMPGSGVTLDARTGRPVGSDNRVRSGPTYFDPTGGADPLGGMRPDEGGGMPGSGLADVPYNYLPDYLTGRGPWAAGGGPDGSMGGADGSGPGGALPKGYYLDAKGALAVRPEFWAPGG